MVQGNYLNLDSDRAVKARIFKALDNKFLRQILNLSAVAFLLFGLMLLYAMPKLSGLFLSVGLLTLSIRFWTAGELSQLNKNIGNKTGKVDDVLDQQILANMKNGSQSAYLIWKAIERLSARYFFQNRFVLPTEIFENMLSKDPSSEAVVWRNTEALRSKLSMSYYSQELVMAGLILSLPDAEGLLNKLKLSRADIENGVLWMSSLSYQHKQAREKKNFGGLARDWTYGYTPVLQSFGYSISREIELYGFFQDTSLHQQVVGGMIQSMSNTNKSIAIVGENGSGKTTTAYAFAEQILSASSPKNLRYKQVVMLDASAMISRATRPGQLEQLVIHMINEAHKAKNIILFFDNAEVFFSEGVGAVDLSNVLSQALESGAVRMIFAITPKQWQSLQARGSSLTSKIQSVNLPEANESDSIRILQNQILLVEFKHKCTFTYQALREAYKLGKRYEDSLAMPGAALKVLEEAPAYTENGYVTDAVIKLSLERSKGVKLQTAQAGEATNLLDLEKNLSQHVISQKRAIRAVSDALRRSRSGVGSADRPVGTFLFIGPTGVGKTELTKALARVYFGDESSIVRVDMNQFVEPSDVNRLVSAGNEGDQLSFLGQMRKKPFSVVLLDEIEKAHPSVLGLLLQMLDEGVMKDSNNKQVSFKDSIIIATSNAGANDIRSMVSSGEINQPDAEDKIVEKLINDRIFTPEFVNRYDEVVLFEPLTPDDLVQVVSIIIGSINKTLEPQKIQVSVDEAGKKWLINKGYDPMLGARPMRRMAQRYVENIVAKKVLSQEIGAGGVINLTVADFESQEQ
ncbi:MAG: AAA family ATPase [Patescibacteria group bacterium]